MLFLFIALKSLHIPKVSRKNKQNKPIYSPQLAIFRTTQQSFGMIVIATTTRKIEPIV